nr:helix-turn-helix transcriptional regulator [uncultured Rhodopila sp.]
MTDDGVGVQQQDAAWLTPRDKQIGSHIRRRRVQMGMSRSRLALALGISENQVEAYELGRIWLGATRLFKIADILGVDLAFFYAEIPGGAARDPGAAGQAAGIAGDPCLVAVEGGRYFGGARG